MLVIKDPELAAASSVAKLSQVQNISTRSIRRTILVSEVVLVRRPRRYEEIFDVLDEEWQTSCWMSPKSLRSSGGVGFHATA